MVLLASTWPFITFQQAQLLFWSLFSVCVALFRFTTALLCKTFIHLLISTYYFKRHKFHFWVIHKYTVTLETHSSSATVHIQSLPTANVTGRSATHELNLQFILVKEKTHLLEERFNFVVLYLYDLVLLCVIILTVSMRGCTENAYELPWKAQCVSEPDLLAEFNSFLVKLIFLKTFQ